MSGESHGQGTSCPAGGREGDGDCVANNAAGGEQGDVKRAKTRLKAHGSRRQGWLLCRRPRSQGEGEAAGGGRVGGVGGGSEAGEGEGGGSVAGRGRGGG